MIREATLSRAYLILADRSLKACWSVSPFVSYLHLEKTILQSTKALFCKSFGVIIACVI